MPPPPLTVLAVDDTPAVRAVLERALAPLGYVTLTAMDGLDALDVAAGHAGPLALVITDLDMPRLGGAALARALGVSRPETPVLFISGARPPHDLSDSAVGRPAAFLAKPFDSDGLANAVAELVGSSPVARRA